MKDFERYNPAVVFFYLILCAMLPVFSVNPVILCVSLLFSVFFYSLTVKKKSFRFHLFCIAVFAAVTVINPIFSHNGKTALFILNNNPVTLEALLYGAGMGVALVSALYWFSSFSEIMTSDKIMYIFGSFSPKSALLISMVLRYVPLIRKKSAQISDAQKLMGQYSDSDYTGNMRNRLRVYSATATWALETGIITADSMEARGYSSGNRTRFALYGFTSSDALLTAAMIIFFAFFTAGGLLSPCEFSYYPEITPIPADIFSVICYAAYLLMAAVPTLTKLVDKLKWKYLISRI